MFGFICIAALTFPCAVAMVGRMNRIQLCRTKAFRLHHGSGAPFLLPAGPPHAGKTSPRRNTGISRLPVAVRLPVLRWMHQS